MRLGLTRAHEMEVAGTDDCWIARDFRAGVTNVMISLTKAQAGVKE